MTNDKVNKTFRTIVAKTPDWMIRSFEINRLLEDYEKTREQAVKEIGEAAQAKLEQHTAHELAEELIARVRRGEPA